ncbi:hypothetical protein T4E_5454 [Trichinella pseudospiralis]|uniref:Uncharacterized protein n=1 Tax=Trichinella pseudospiralis TaxID=6337 RepID=A0A0V0YLA5_TRIPS|nr:hypothetical protein T4E_5454 [Trichinella pseudospiralis]
MDHPSSKFRSTKACIPEATNSLQLHAARHAPCKTRPNQPKVTVTGWQAHTEAQGRFHKTIW